MHTSMRIPRIYRAHDQAHTMHVLCTSQCTFHAHAMHCTYLARVAHGCGAADEAGCGTVERGEAAEAAEDERDVAPEDPAVHVRLIDDDVPG